MSQQIDFKVNGLNMRQHIDHKANGYDVKCLHSGQKRRYGDTYREFSVKTDKSYEEVEKYCTETIYPCKLTTKEYFADIRAGVKDLEDNFRSNYELIKKGDEEYFYRVTEPSTH